MRAVTGLLRVVIVAAILTACGPMVGPRPLPADPAWQGGCGIGVGHDMVLRGAADDPRLTWAIDRDSGQRTEILWPAGHHARFSPSLEVLDARGRIVGREVDLIIGSCSMPPIHEDALVIDEHMIRGPDWRPGDG